MKLSDLNLRDIGNTIQITGCVYTGHGIHHLCFFPGEQLGREHVETVEMDLNDWQIFLKQTDTLETEILAKAKDKTITKAIVRKAERQINTNVQWAVFRRDGYKCRYCGKDDMPLTVDHLVLWEEGGPSIETNLVAACKKCNRTRGNMQYGDWLKDSYYLKTSEGIAESARSENAALLATLDSIPRNIQMRSR
jgi:HNH endonuclease